MDDIVNTIQIELNIAYQELANCEERLIELNEKLIPIARYNSQTKGISKASTELQGNLQRQTSILRDRTIPEIKARINFLKIQLKLNKADADLLVSDHAIVRYCERILGMDLDKIRKEIVHPEIVERYRKYGDGKYEINGVLRVIENSTIVTLYN